jgi:hypothetical protein
VIALNKKDGFAASSEIGFKEAAMTFFRASLSCKAQQDTEDG